MKDGRITDRQLSASSEYLGEGVNRHFSANYARLDLVAAPTEDLSAWHCGCWAVQTIDVNQWIEVNFGVDSRSVTGVILQGRDHDEQWVTKYKVSYSNNNGVVNWRYVQDLTEEDDMVRFGKTQHYGCAP